MTVFRDDSCCITPLNRGACARKTFDTVWTLLPKSCLGKGVFPPHTELRTNLRVGFFASLYLEEAHSLQENYLLTRNLK